LPFVARKIAYEDLKITLHFKKLEELSARRAFRRKSETEISEVVRSTPKEI
jgi:hypothetical protein